MPTKAKSTEIEVLEIRRESVTVRMIGRSPFICNSMSGKTKQQLLLPPARKNAADKAASLKHNPPEEMRNSIYRARDAMPTALAIPAIMIKGCLRNAAVDLPGSSKAQIGRLCFVEGDYLPLYGQPELLMSVVRSADMNRTPDIRTRAIIPEWCAEATITYVQSLLKEKAVLNLLAAAGIMQGVGDFRPEKGKGNYGQFELVGADDKRFDEIVKRGAREQQEAALKDFAFYDHESEELYKWWLSETKRRGFKVVA